METGALTYADGYPTETSRRCPAQVELQGLPVLTYTCVGMAWGKGSEGRGTGFTALNTDRRRRRNEARNLQRQSNGLTCVATVRCSGRAHISGYKARTKRRIDRRSQRSRLAQ